MILKKYSDTILTDVTIWAKDGLDNKENNTYNLHIIHFIIIFANGNKRELPITNKEFAT